jgi:hypothetical protein
MQQRSDGVDDAVHGRVRNPEQGPELAHGQVRAPVHGDYQHPIRQVQSPRPARASVGGGVTAAPGDQAYQAVELCRA